MIMLDIDPIFAPLRGMANIQINRLIRDMEVSDAEAGTMTIRIRVDRRKEVVPRTPELSRVAMIRTGQMSIEDLDEEEEDTEE